MCCDTISASIKKRIDMRTLLDRLKIYPTRGNNCYKCIFHDDNNPSAGITKDGKTFHCFACGISASVIDVVMRILNLDYLSACKWIDDEFTLGIFKELGENEKIELKLAEEKRRKEKEQKEHLFEMRKKILKKICEELEICKQIQKETHITKGEYRKGEWALGDLYFYALKRQKWLNWLYDTILEIPCEECEWDYTIGKNAEDIIKKIEENKLEI